MEAPGPGFPPGTGKAAGQAGGEWGSPLSPVVADGGRRAGREEWHKAVDSHTGEILWASLTFGSCFKKFVY